MRLILPAKLVPDGTEVTKATGNVAFTLKHKLTIFGEGVKQIERVSEDIMFLVGERGNINAITGSLEVAIHFDSFAKLQEFLSLHAFTTESHQ